MIDHLEWIRRVRKEVAAKGHVKKVAVAKKEMEENKVSDFAEVIILGVKSHKVMTSNKLLAGSCLLLMTSHQIYSWIWEDKGQNFQVKKCVVLR